MHCFIGNTKGEGMHTRGGLTNAGSRHEPVGPGKRKSVRKLKTQNRRERNTQEMK